MRIDVPSTCQETQTLPVEQPEGANFANKNEKGSATLENSLA